MSTERSMRGKRSTLALISAIMMSGGLVRSSSRDSSLFLVSLAVVLLVGAIGALRSDSLSSLISDRLGRAAEIGFVVLGVVLSGVALSQVLTPAATEEWLAILGFIGVVALAAVGVLITHGRNQSRALNVFLAAYGVIMLVVLAWTYGSFVDAPQVDVTYFQSGAIEALRSGQNPFATTYEQIHGISGKIPIYGEGVVVSGVLQFGFPYMPLSLLVVAPFQWFAGDFRIAFLAATIASAWMIGNVGSGTRPKIVAAGFVLAAPFVVMITVGWTEPLLVLAAVGVVFAHERRSPSRPWLAGAFVALKQYTPIIAPAYLLLLGRPFTLKGIVRDGWKALVVVAVTTLPFVFWGPEAFVRSTLVFHLRQPSRPDSLSFATHIPALLDSPVVVSAAVSMGVIGAALLFGLVKATDDAQGFALTSGLAMGAWLLFGRQAFENYYLLVMAFIVMAAAFTDGPETSQERSLADVRSRSADATRD